MHTNENTRRNVISQVEMLVLLFFCIVVPTVMLCHLKYVRDSYIDDKSFQQASYVLEEYATSYNDLQSTDHFLGTIIDVADTENGKDVAILVYQENSSWKIVFFHVSSDLSYSRVKQDETVFAELKNKDK